jgi:hypothetical protein
MLQSKHHEGSGSDLLIPDTVLKPASRFSLLMSGCKAAETIRHDLFLSGEALVFHRLDFSKLDQN